MAKYVYSFTQGVADGSSEMAELLGEKGANLAEMSTLGLPVPPGFTLTTAVCKEFHQGNNSYPSAVHGQVAIALKKLESQMGKRFGDSKNPLLLSIRSGGRRSMPGMMDTILNLGLNEQSVKGLVAHSADPFFAYDTYRRFIQMYAHIVMGMDNTLLEKLLEDKKRSKGVCFDSDLSVSDLRQLIREFKICYREHLGCDFHEDPEQQLWTAISAVFSAWMDERAVTYRRLNNIPSHWGTAVNVEAMVFGNMGNDCATGVAFTRDPVTGEDYLYGEYLFNAQGEDVVAGNCTPHPLNKVNNKTGASQAMEDVFPACYDAFLHIRRILEIHFHDMQYIEFTIQSGKLYLLQTRTGKRTASAAVRIAVEMVQQKMLSKRNAVLRVDSAQLEQLLHPTLDPSVNNEIIAHGLPASPGACTGKVVFSVEAATQLLSINEKIILVRVAASSEDILAMSTVQGVLTACGGITSHAAVIARGMGTCCIAGCSDLQIDYEKQQFHTKSGYIINQGDLITLDGNTGDVILGAATMVPVAISGDLATLLGWADKYRHLEVRCNVDTAIDAVVARKFGAQGIGLCRTEQMFFGKQRIQATREMILASDLFGREKALHKIMPFHKQDFMDLFVEMKGLPVTIRLLDPPLQYFLPQSSEDIAELANTVNRSFSDVKARFEQLQEFNPMFGHRGCRLGISYPEIYGMQVRAIMEAACELTKEQGYKISPEIIIPLVSDERELEVLRCNITEIAQAVLHQYDVHFNYKIGSMIELPRAALRAEQIAQHADFFSFGSNDLTQATYGLSRDDAGGVLTSYIKNNVFNSDPFSTLDFAGVGQLMQIAIAGGRRCRANLQFGICGEHGGDPESIIFCHQLGLDYVSCSPYRVPIARLAAAHAALSYGL